MTTQQNDSSVQLKRAPRLRLLPLVIFLASLTLGFRVFDVWQGVEVAAQEEEAPAAEAGNDTDQAAGNQEETESEGTANDLSTDAADVDITADEQASGTAKDLTEVDPFSMTETEIELLQSLASRRQELEQREKTLEEKEALLKAAETRVEEKVARLEEVQGKVEALLGQYDDEEQHKLDNLVAIYEKMKPKDAARIFEQLDMEVLLSVVTRMKERITAPILAEMRPDRAQQITVRMAERQEMPVIGE